MNKTVKYIFAAFCILGLIISIYMSYDTNFEEGKFNILTFTTLSILGISNIYNKPL